MAILLTGTTIGGHSAIHAGNLATHGIITTSNIGSYAITSIPTSFSSITVTSSFDTASNDIYASMRVIRNNSAITDGMYIGYGNSGSGITRIFGGGSTTGALVKATDYTYEPGSFRAPIFYDSDNTTYYFDGNSTTSLRTRGSWRSDSSDWDGEYAGKIQYHDNHWYFQSGNFWFFRNAGGANVFQVDQSGNGTFNGDIYLGTRGTWLSSYLNQDVRTSASPSFASIYLNGTQLTGTQTQQLKNTLDITGLPYKCDIVINGDPDTFYPVHFIWGNQDVWRRIIINRGYSEQAPWDPIGTGVHHGGLLIDWEGNFGGWGGAEYSDRLRVFNQSYTDVCADMYIYTHSMGYVFMLRGGGTTGALYHIYSDQEIRGYNQVGTPDIAYNTSTLFYDHSIVGYRVYAPAPLTLAQINSSRIDGLRTKKQSLLDNRYLRQGVDISGIGTVSATNFLASNAFYLNSYNYYLNSYNGGIYTNARFESAGTIYASGGNSNNWNTAYSWGNHASAGYVTSSALSSYLPLSGGTMSGHLNVSYNIASPSNYYSGLQAEIMATSGTAGIALHRSGYSHVGIYHDSINELKFNFNGGTPILPATAGTLWGSGNLTNLSQLTNGPGYITSSALSGYATQSWVQSQGFLTSLPSHNHDDRYYTEGESDGRYAYKAGAAGQDFSADRLSSYYLRNHYGVGTNHSYGMYFDNDLSSAYAIFREAGAWDHPYPDLRIAFHTGIKLGANSGYNGIRFYTDYDMTTQVMSVNNGSDGLGGGNVYVNNSLQAGSSLRAPIFYDSADTNYYLDPNSSSKLSSLGLGGISPDARLSVSGDTHISGYIYQGGNAAASSSWGSRTLVSSGNYTTNANTFRFDNLGYGTTWDVRFDSSGAHASHSFRAPIFYDSNDTNYYGDFAGFSYLNQLGLASFQYIGGQTSNGQSNYQWDGADYRDPNQWTARLILRRDNATTGINGSIPSLVIFNNNGANQTTASMVFATNECVTGSNSVNLAGIIAKKESVGNCGGWSAGSLNFFVKNFGARVDSLALTPDGNATFSGIVYSTGYGNSSQWNTAYSWGNHASAGYLTGAHNHDDRYYTESESDSRYIDFTSNQNVTGIKYFLTNNGYYSGSTDSAKLQVYATGANAAFMSFHRGGNYAVNFGLDGDNVMRIGGWSAAADRWVLDMSGNNTVAGSFRAPIFYDSANTNFYGDFASTSVMNSIRFGTSTNNATLSGNSDWGIRLSTDVGYIQFGPANGSYAHIYTDRDTFYFNRDILINGYSVITSSNIGSQSVSNASTAGGLAVHSSRNNEANKIVRTDVNGYIQAGWINTPSGVFSSAITKIYCSDDDYVRFQTPATFISNLGLITTSNIGSQSVSYASSAGSVAWTNVSSRPTALSQFTNDLGNYGGFLTSITAHTHAISDVSGLQTALDGKQAAGSYAASSHTHDDRYYTESESDTRFARKDTDSAISGNLVIGNGTYGSSTAYGNSGARLMFSGSDGDAQGNYYIGTNHNDYGGNYSKLELRWHTGIRMGAQPGYGGIRFYDTEDLGTVIFSVGTGDSHVRVVNNLYVGGNLALHAGNYNSYSPTLTGGNASGTWGISVTGNAATVGGYAVSGSVGANTVVIRDANNYIYAHYINSNVSESENPTINSFYTSNGDGWLRKSSVAHVKSQLGLGSMAYESSGTYQTVSGAINTGNIGSQSVSYATISQQLTKFGDIYGQDWNTYYVNGKMIVSSVYGGSGPNFPTGAYNYGAMLSYGVTGSEFFQVYFPENGALQGGAFRKLHYRTGWNGSWSAWKSVVDQEGQVCTIAGSNQTGIEIHSNVSYNQDPLTYFLMRGQADSSWKAFKVRLTGDAGGQDIEFRRIAENGTDSRMWYVPRGANTVNFEYPIVQPSDSRLKDNITPISTPVDKIKSLCGVEFDWNSGEQVGTHDVGLIAQDVEAVLPEAVTTQEDGYKNLAYAKVIPLLVEAMKEQQAMIDALKAEIELLKNK